MAPRPPLTVTLDRPAGTARLQKDDWGLTVPIGDLPRWSKLYRGLWARKPKGNFGKDITTPGPWAGFYEEDMRALERAVREAGL